MTAQAVARPSGLRVWMLAARVPTLPAAVAPVLVGTGVAIHEGGFRLGVLLAALAAALLIQIGTNYANDYFDFRKGADTVERLGPPRITQMGFVSPGRVRAAALLVFAAAALCGLYLVEVGGWPVVAVGLSSIVAGVLYTGGPWPYGYKGLGDVLCFIFFGLVAVVTTAWLHLDRAPEIAWVAAVPVACLVTAILVVNNLRDINTDRMAGKRTLAVLLGERATRREYLLLLAVAYLTPVFSVMMLDRSPWLLLPLLSLPLARGVYRTVRTQQGRPLNVALKGTARLHLVFCALYAVGLAL